MAKYVSIIKQLMAEGERRNDGQWRLSQIPRAENQGADSIAKMAAEGMAIPNILTEEIKIPSIAKTTVLSIEDNRGWMESIIQYLESGILPNDPREARRLIKKAAEYAYKEGELRKRSKSQP